MGKEDVLNVIVDLSRGVYVVSRNNGKEIVTKLINENGAKSYDSKAMKARRTEIVAGIPYAPGDRVKQIDTTLYDAIEEFDLKYGTNYRKAYVSTTIESIPFKSGAETVKELKQRTRATKAKELEDAGISIEYNLSLFGKAKNLSILDRIKAFRIAFSQRLNGINIKMDTRQNQLPEPIGVTVLDELEKGENAQESNSVAQPKAIIETQDIVPTIEKASEETQKIVPTVEPASKTIQETEARQPKNSKKEKRSQNKKKKQARKDMATDKKPKISRRKTIQASKDKARNEGKLKNRYEEVIKEKEEKKKATEQRRQEAARRAEEQAKRDKEEQERLAKEKKEAEALAKAEQQEPKVEEPDKKVVATPRVRRILAGKNASETGEATFKRFTRKIKNQTESIKNKVHVPKMSKKTIVGAVGVVALVTAATVMIYSGAHNSQANANEPDKTQSAQAVETVTPTESQVPSYETEDATGSEAPSYEAEDATGSEAPSYEAEDTTGSKTPSYEIGDTTGSEETIYEDVKQKEDGDTSNSVDDSRIEYLSSVKVGTTMNIQEGKYYESPNGTGNFGNFEKYKDSTKEITIIGVTTNEGYFQIEDPNVNLYELMQKYPEAKFSYHFVANNKDGTTTVLGWLTENSVENQRVEDNIERVENDMER